jgi:hypothetical protein
MANKKKPKPIEPLIFLVTAKDKAKAATLKI